MKKLFALALLVLSTTALPEEIKVNKMSPDGELERSFVLASQLPDKVVLDCQSFIQGLRIGEQSQAIFFIMDADECEAMQDRVRNSLNRRQLHCIDVDHDIRSDYSCQ